MRTSIKTFAVNKIPSSAEATPPVPSGGRSGLAPAGREARHPFGHSGQSLRKSDDKSTAFLGHYRYIFIARLKLSHTISNYLMIANGHKIIAPQNEVLFVSSSMAV